MTDKILYLPKEKTVKEVQTGIIYPDGTIYWVTDFSGIREDLSTRSGKSAFIKAWREQVIQRSMIVPNDQPRFIQRTITTKYSIPKFAD